MVDWSRSNNLRDYLASQQIVVSYFPHPDPREQRRREIISWIIVLILFTFVCRTIVYLLLRSDNPLVVTLGDPNFLAKEARVALNLIYFLWNMMSLLIICYTKWTQRLPEKQKWMHGISEFFSSDKFRGEKTSRNALNYFKRYTRAQRTIAIVNAFFACLPFFFNTSTNYWPSGAFSAFHYTAVAYATSGLLCNSAPLFAFTYFMYGFYYNSLTKKINLRFKPTYSHLKEEILVFNQMLQTYQFFQPMNNIAFVGTFAARILILYYIFFTNLNIAFKIFFSLFLPLSDQSGQHLHFFSSSYALDRVSQKRVINVFINHFFTD